jgi:hypothetical protein
MAKFALSLAGPVNGAYDLGVRIGCEEVDERLRPSSFDRYIVRSVSLDSMSTRRPFVQLLLPPEK